jgi:transcription termination factor NusB
MSILGAVIGAYQERLHGEKIPTEEQSVFKEAWEEVLEKGIFKAGDNLTQQIDVYLRTKSRKEIGEIDQKIMLLINSIFYIGMQRKFPEKMDKAKLDSLVDGIGQSLGVKISWNEEVKKELEKIDGNKDK